MKSGIWKNISTKNRINHEQTFTNILFLIPKVDESNKKEKRFQCKLTSVGNVHSFSIQCTLQIIFKNKRKEQTQNKSCQRQIVRTECEMKPHRKFQLSNFNRQCQLPNMIQLVFRRNSREREKKRTHSGSHIVKNS